MNLPIRSELIHPMFVHFPIAFTVFALLCYLGMLFFQHSWWSISARTFLSLAVFFLAMALFTGDFASDNIRRDLCQVNTLHEHEEQAYRVLYFCLAALSMEFGLWFFATGIGRKICHGILILCLLGANASLIRTGHQGAKLVYEQGAGMLKNLRPNCESY